MMIIIIIIRNDFCLRAFISHPPRASTTSASHSLPMMLLPLCFYYLCSAATVLFNNSALLLSAPALLLSAPALLSPPPIDVACSNLLFILIFSPFYLFPIPFLIWFFVILKVIGIIVIIILIIRDRIIRKIYVMLTQTKKFYFLNID
jgi:hypothetical protein